MKRHTIKEIVNPVTGEVDYQKMKLSYDLNPISKRKRREMAKKAEEEALIECFKVPIAKMNSLGIQTDDKYCDRMHAYVVHAFKKPEFKCTVFMKTLRWVPFGYHKGVSGQGIESLNEFLDKGKIDPEKEKYTYLERIQLLKSVLETIRNETNCEIIDEAIEKYCD